MDTEQRCNGGRAEEGRAGDALRAYLVEWYAAHKPIIDRHGL